jgi:hypothetical protein
VPRPEDYVLTSVLSDGLVMIERSDHLGRTSNDLWVSGPLRKPARCVVSGRDLAPGDRAFRPARGTQEFRSERIDAAIIARAIASTARAPSSQETP